MPLSEEHAALIPEDIRSDPTISVFNDVGSIAKSYVESRKLIGNSIQLPGKDSKPEDVDRWSGETSAKLKDHGLTLAKLSDAPPEKPDGYEFTIEGATPEQIKGDKILGSFRENAHKMGLNNAQAARLVEWYMKDAVPGLTAGADRIEMVEDAAQVEKVLGDVFKGETKQTLAARDQAVTLLKSEIPELADFLEGTAPFGKPWMANKDHPAMVKLLKFVAEAKQQDFGGNIEGLSASDTVDSVDSQIADMRAKTDLSPAEIGKRLEPLYKKKAFLMKKAS
jgi:hypothetical protein